MPHFESKLEGFKQADTQVLGVSVDSRFSQENWAISLGGISFPILADFHPKGAVGAQYGLYLAEKGIISRSSVLVDKQGAVRWVEVVPPGGIRNPQELLEECQKLNAAQG